MKGIYLTEQGKQEIEAKIAELEYIFEREGELFSSRDSGKYHLYKEILSSATILPVEERWDNIVAIINMDSGAVNALNYSHFPNGVIIQPKQ
jgi:hypothetical protein